MKQEIIKNHFKEQEDKYNIFLDKNKFVIARIDGRAFHTLTKSFNKPFDAKFAYTMNYVARVVKEAVNADVAYVQSDEVSFGWTAESWQRNKLFDGRVNKINTLLAATASVAFKEIYTNERATFDCRVFTLDSQKDYIEYFLWRSNDCFKNAVSMIAHSLYTHKELHEASTRNRLSLISQKGGDINDYDKRNIYGCLFYTTQEIGRFTQEEINKLPINHNARKNPDMEFSRNVTKAYTGDLRNFDWG